MVNEQSFLSFYVTNIMCYIYYTIKNVGGKNFGELGELQAIHQKFFSPIFTAFNRIVHSFTLPMVKP